MNISIETIRTFVEKIRTISFLERIFAWKGVKNKVTDALISLQAVKAELENGERNKGEIFQQLSDCRKDLQLALNDKVRIESLLHKAQENNTEKDARLTALNNQYTTASTHCSNFESQVQALKIELAENKESLRQVQKNFSETREECLHLKKEEERRREEHVKTLHTFEKWREQITADRNREIEERQESELQKLRLQKQTWVEHESSVKNKMKSLCQKLTIEYADTVPFKGTPDNTIKLCNEYIIFDAKSPASDDLSNFPTYLKDQAEKAKKYAKIEGVKKDVFLVVPGNTLDVVKQTHFPFGDYDVFVVSADVLEPLLLCLQKIETYEFADQLTPEERENICRVIGRFAHLTKRRIQIDSFFAKQFIEIIYKCESDLPEDIKKQVAEFEKAEKLNPPADRRTKAIENKQLEKDVNQLELEIGSKGISVEDLSESLNEVKLYRE